MSLPRLAWEAFTLTITLSGVWGLVRLMTWAVIGADPQ